MENTDQKYYDTPGHEVEPPIVVPEPAPAEIQPIESPLQASPVKKSKFNKKIIMITSMVIAVVIIILLVLSFVVNGGKGVPNIIPQTSMTPSPTATAIPRPASPYEDDPEVIKLQEDLQALDTKLNSTDLREDTLRIPVLEWNVKF